MDSSNLSKAFKQPKRERTLYQRSWMEIAYDCGKLDGRSLAVTSGVTLSLAIAVAMATFTAFQYIEKQILASVEISVRDLSIQLTRLDNRRGYSADVVESLLLLYGHDGRILYLLFEIMDIALFIKSYRAIFVIIINNLVNILKTFELGADILSYLTFLPILAGGLDYLENIGHITMTLCFDYDSSIIKTTLWGYLTKISSLVNRCKWLFLILSVVAAMFLAFIVISTYILYYLGLIRKSINSSSKEKKEN